MGMAYVYAYTGTLSFTDFPGLYGNQLAQVQQIASLADFIEQLKGFLAQPMILLGSGLIVIAIAFKLSLAPFHKWTPDVYQGAPAPIATYLATVAKVATIGLLVRFILSSGFILVPSIVTVLTVIAVLSI